jgi:hypothetical protein
MCQIWAREYQTSNMDGPLKSPSISNLEVIKKEKGALQPPVFSMKMD